MRSWGGEKRAQVFLYVYLGSSDGGADLAQVANLIHRVHLLHGGGGNFSDPRDISEFFLVEFCVEPFQPRLAEIHVIAGVTEESAVVLFPGALVLRRKHQVAELAIDLG